MLQHFPKVSPNLRLKPPNRNAEADTERFYHIKSTGDVKQSLYCGLLYVSAYGMSSLKTQPHRWLRHPNRSLLWKTGG
jgi:hypothetical protein